MTPIQFTVHAVPVAQPRQRHRIARTKTGKMFSQNFTPTKDPVNAFKASVQQAAAGAYDGPPLDDPLSVSLVFVLPRPKAKVWKRKPMSREPHVGRGDADNFAKAVLDALSGVLWRDDRQVAHLDVWKWIAAGDEQPGVNVTVAAAAGGGRKD